MKSSTLLKYLALLGFSFALFPMSAEVQALADIKDSNNGTCQSSWFNMNADRPKVEASVSKVGSSTNILGFKVIERYPQVEASGVKFSALLNVRFDHAKASVQTQLSKQYSDCTNADGYRSCGSSLGPKQTVTLMEIREGSRPLTLISCFQFAEK
jgi:hypothetical protein